MAPTFQSLGLGNLSTEQKLEFVSHLWDDLRASANPGGLLTDAQRKELLHRKADAVEHPDDWESWESVQAAALKSLAR